MKRELSSVDLRNIGQLLDTQRSKSLHAANWTDFPYCGWAEIDLKLTANSETKIKVFGDEGENLPTTDWLQCYRTYC